jgi:dynein intermediate chain, cytosolic
LVNSLVGSGASNGTSRTESVISSSGMSDSETASQKVELVSVTSGNYSTSVLYPILDIAPPAPSRSVDKEVVTYSKEVQTAAWVPDQVDEEEGEEVVKRRVEEEVRKELEQLRLDEQRAKEEELHRLEAEREVPGNSHQRIELIIVISEEEQQRILTSDTFHDFLSRSSKIVERALDEDYDVLVDYTMDVEANQYILLYSS